MAEVSPSRPAREAVSERRTAPPDRDEAGAGSSCGMTDSLAQTAIEAIPTGGVGSNRFSYEWCQ
eukprot:876369-Prorocentrum_minimum.AAC.3